MHYSEHNNACILWKENVKITERIYKCLLECTGVHNTYDAYAFLVKIIFYT